ncbi:GAF domain-containing protein [Deinococcus peraridilitoris]|uniref:histidine kinase n=1 Tax=Deinococcus peraridilitoris (strain DSM 19664 / LMG 22246 / CIP 109416 / KR-200) TaxID=937777 RepID=L0A9E6_DEIPD|nr:GAF domain-containing protein [Deinococcus peraridilitoris]AFZ69752.1 bacteriophytochrome (light-regulated signal transduction histidine kinase) [Deinococcus peraridilitoris DSM 19664]
MTLPHDPLVTDALLPLLDASPDPTFTLNTQGRFTYANPATGTLLHRSPLELIGCSLEQDFPHAFSVHWLKESRRARAEGRSVEYEAYSPAYEGWVRVHVTPSAAGLAVRLQSITQQQRATALQSVTTSLAETHSAGDVVKVLVQQAVAASGAYMAALVAPTPDGEHLRLVDELGYPPELRARFEHFPLTLGIPPCDAATQRSAIFVSGEDFDRQYPATIGVRADQTRSLASLPLIVAGELWGVLALSFQEARRFGDSERLFLQTLVQQCTQVLERLNADARLHEQTEILRALNRVNQTISAELDLNQLVQAVTDAGVELTGAQFGAFFYNTVGEQQEVLTLYTLSGAAREAFAGYPLPRMTQVFGPTFAGEGVIRVADITRDPRYGHNAPHYGMPAGHLPVRSYLAVPVVSRTGEVPGALFFGHAEPGVFTAQAEQLAVGLAAQTAIALDNARLFRQVQDSHAQLERRVEARTRELEEQRVALDAFAAFTERSVATSDPQTLAGQAVEVLRATLGEVSVGYYELEGTLWKGRVLSDNVPPAVVAAAKQGFPADLPSFARAVSERHVLFVDGWNAERERADSTDVYGAAAFWPYFVHGEPFGLFTMASPHARAWSPRARAVFQSVARSLSLAFERAEQTTRLAEQNAELAIRTQALEAFAQLTRDLTLDADRYTLVRKAQEIVLSLLPEGYAVYWEREGNQWRQKSQVGDLQSDELQRQVDAGLPYFETRTVRLPFESGEPLYQDEYDKHHDNLESTVGHISTTASLPIKVGGTVLGVIVLGLFDQRGWTATDRALLDTVMRSLSLTLEGATSARALQERTAQLERSNAELEKFAFVASHDLQEPLRTIASFSELINRRYQDVLDEPGRKYLSLVTRSAERMKGLIDELLVFSRLNTIKEPLVPVPAEEPLREALARLHGLIELSGASITYGELPVVLGAPSELTQLFQNLIGNAMKFRKPDVKPEITVMAQLEGQQWHFEVRDNGLGFEPKYAERIFQIFQRLHLREQYEGTGMGLAIVRKVLEHHGGRVWAESEPGVGSQFHFTIPAVEGDA